MKTLLLAAFLSLTIIAVSAQQSPCSAKPEYKQLNFWIGDWKVLKPDGTIVGYNKIESILDGCAVLENWVGTSGSEGKSFNYFDISTGKWHQKWIDNYGQPLELEGMVIDESIIYRGVSANPNGGSELMNEMILEKVDENEVHQLWKQSSDRGESWTIAFDGIYKRKNKIEPE